MINQELMDFALKGKLQPVEKKEKKKEKKKLTASEYFGLIRKKKFGKRLSQENRGIFDYKNDICNYI